MDAPKNKVEAFAKSKRMRMIFITLTILIVLGLLSYGIIWFIKKRKAAAVTQDTGSSTGKSSITDAGAGTAATTKPDPGVNTTANIKAVQAAINRDHPEAKLAVDGIAGNLTNTAIIKYYGASSLPLTQDSLAKIIGGTKTPVGFKAPTGPNDDFPLQIGSKGNLVTAVKNMVNKISGSTLDTYDDTFDEDTYNALITGVGSKYYPVTDDNFIAINDAYNKKTGQVPYGGG